MTSEMVTVPSILTVSVVSPKTTPRPARPGCAASHAFISSTVSKPSMQFCVARDWMVMSLELASTPHAGGALASMTPLGCFDGALYPLRPPAIVMTSITSCDVDGA